MSRAREEMRSKAQAWGRGAAAGWRLPRLVGLRSTVVAAVFLAHCYGVWAERRLGARPLRLRVVSLRGWQSLRAETTVWSCWQFNCFCCSLTRLRKRQEGQDIPHCDSVCSDSLRTKSVKGFFGTINLSRGF